MMDWTPIIVGVAGALFAYWIVIRSAPHLPKPWRRRLIIGYASFHLGSWVAMHLLVAIPFAADVRAMHARALASIPLEIAQYKAEGTKPDAEYIRHIERHVNATPWYSVWSAAPVPLILFSSANYQIGPLWGLGVVRVHLWTVTKFKCIFAGKMWIS